MTPTERRLLSGRQRAAGSTGRARTRRAAADEIDRGRRDGGALTPSQGIRTKASSSAPSDRAGRIGGIEEAARRADCTVPRCERPDQEREAFRPSGTAGCRPARRPAARRASGLFASKRREERGDLRQRHGRRDAEHGNADFEHRIETAPAGQRDPPDGRTARPPSPSPAKNALTRGRHGVDIDADDERKLLDPEHLVDQRGRARHEQQQRRMRQWCAIPQPRCCQARSDDASAWPGSGLDRSDCSGSTARLLPAR